MNDVNKIIQEISDINDKVNEMIPGGRSGPDYECEKTRLNVQVVGNGPDHDDPNDNRIIPSNIYTIKCPCVIGFNGHFNKINIPGIINEHLYSVIGISLDEYNNKYLHVFNPHHNVDGRHTIYNKLEDNFISKIDKNRYGKWSLNEIILFISDLTYSKII